MARCLAEEEEEGAGSAAAPAAAGASSLARPPAAATAAQPDAAPSLVFSLRPGLQMEGRQFRAVQKT